MTFQLGRPSQSQAFHGSRYVNPRWLPGLEFCPDIQRTIPSVPPANAPGATFPQSSVAAPSQTVQMTGVNAVDWQQRFDGYGPVMAKILPNVNGVISDVTGPPTPTTGISMSVWYRADNLGTLTRCLGRGSSTRGYAFMCDIPHFFFQVDNGGSAFLIYDGVPSVGFWYHLAGTWDGITQISYMNGYFAKKQATAGPFQNGNGDRWGLHGVWSDFGNAQQGVARYGMVWRNRILTPAEIYDLYINPSPYIESPRDTNILNMAFVGPPIPPSPPTPRPAILDANDFLNKRHEQLCNITTINLDGGPQALFTTNTVDFRAGSHRTFVAYVVVLGQTGLDYSGRTISFGSSSPAGLSLPLVPYTDWLTPTVLPSSIPSTGYCFYVPQGAVTYGDGVTFYINPGLVAGPKPARTVTVQAFGWWT